MHYYLEKAIEHRVEESVRGHRNTAFVREARGLERADRRGILAALVCRLTSWTPLQLCPEPMLEPRLCSQAVAGYETDGRSRW